MSSRRSSPGAPMARERALGDYRCVDFDEGLPDSAVWVPNVVADGTLELSTARAYSAPASMATHVLEAAAFADRTTAQLEWSAVGATAVDGVFVDFQLNPTALPALLTPWGGSVRLACVVVGGGTVCLSYTLESDRQFASAYTGLFIAWSYVAGAAILGECEVTESLDFGLWNSVTLNATAAGDVSVDINGVSASAGCVGGGFTTDTVATFSVGTTVIQSTTWYFDAHYDNVVASVLRQ